MKSKAIFFLVLFASVFSVGLNAQSEAHKVVDGKNYIVHKVASGETLYGISKKYNVAVKDLQAANDLAGGLKAGQEILIPTSSKSEVSVSPSNAYKYHTVSSGETLSAIAKKYNTTVDELKSLNSLTSTSIKVGQSLKVPLKGEAKIEVVESAEVTPAVEVVKEEQPKVAESKPANVKKPANPRSEKPNTGDSGKKAENAEGGMPRTAEVLAETATEKEETGTALVKSDQMDQSRTFVMHPTLPKGSIIVVINEATGKMAYCRVVDNIKPSELNGASVAITKTVADKIGLKDSKGTVKIKYAAP